MRRQNAGCAINVLVQSLGAKETYQRLDARHSTVAQECNANANITEQVMPG